MMSDNTTALHWMNKPLRSLKLYVSNRVKTIQRLTNIENWKHIRTKENPADLVSRGVQANEIVTNKLWWHGPKWLSEPQQNWPEPIDL